MSLSKLPIELIAQISSFLEFEEIKNLLSTNKKINGALKYHKLDKPSYFQVRLQRSMNDPGHTTASLISINHEKTVVQTFQRNDPDILPKFLSIFRKFSVIEKVYIVFIPEISNDFLRLMSDGKVKVKDVWFIRCDLLFLKDVLFQMYKTFEKVTFSGCGLNLEEIANDEVFTKLVKFNWINFESKYTYMAGRFSMTEVELSDKTLEAMTTEFMPEKFHISDWITSFTVKGIEKLLEYSRTNNTDRINWYLGVMKPDQMGEANQFIADLDDAYYEVETRAHFEDFVYYQVARYGIETEAFCVNFRVLKDHADQGADAGDEDMYDIENEDQESGSDVDEEMDSEDQSDEDSGEEDPMNE